MKVLVICQYYYPEPFSITNICEELVKCGHEVMVVTGIPNYPMGKIYDGYRGGKKRDEVINGVNVHRCFTVGRHSGPIWRFVNYYSYMFSSSCYVSQLKEQFDVVFVNQLSPVMMARAGIKYKRKNGIRLLLYCLDLWPESLITGGIKRNSPIYKMFHRISEKIYRQADKIFITSKSFSEYFSEEFGINNTEYLPQYAENVFKPEICRKAPNGTVDLMFAGNVGAAQGVDTIIRAAALTRDIPNLRWHIVGDGSELDNCKRLADELSVASVIFHGRKPIEEMPRFYAMADAMIVSLNGDSVSGKTLPGKVQSYLAAGKPIIAVANGDTRRVIEEAECGYCSEPENPEQLAENVRTLIKCGDISAKACNAVNYYNNNFTKEMFMQHLITALED